MSISRFSLRALMCTIAAVLAGCGGNNTLNPSPAGSSAERRPARSAYRVLYDFKGGTDGADPGAGLINVGNKFYGTTGSGGKRRAGTIFAMTTSGRETVLHRFVGRNGNGPDGDLLDVNGTLYGTTAGGGAYCKKRSHSCGTVFSIAASGKETLLHSFGAPGDGAIPLSDLVDVNGTLYGTTEYGGANCIPAYEGCGTVFSITTAGVEKVLYSFTGAEYNSSGDGQSPAAGLLNVNGTLYGTTEYGGAYCRSTIGCGTVFSITTSGKETVLHGFSFDDGANPQAGLVYVDGTLFGTTEAGGAHGSGTVFSITMSGKETVLHSFGDALDGVGPQAGLLNVNGRLFGTTQYGGRSGGRGGTVFSITISGKEAVLHSFGASGDGHWPVADLLDVGGTIYGTTRSGGTTDSGTVFALSP